MLIIFLSISDEELLHVMNTVELDLNANNYADCDPFVIESGDLFDDDTKRVCLTKLWWYYESFLCVP